MNYTDYSTLQYLPAFQTYLATEKAHQNPGSFLGMGNGWAITRSINTHLTQHFNNYLKEKSAVPNCVNIPDETLCWDGPAVLNGALQPVQDAIRLKKIRQ